MATAPQQKWTGNDLESGDLYEPKSGHTLPGYTVDALLAEGNVDEAREELGRLLQEGIDSGISSEPPDQMMNRIRAKVRARAATR